MHKRFYIIISGILFLILISYLVIKINENETQRYDNQIIINEKDKICILDEDCIVISNKCEDCGLDVINKVYVEKYKLELAQVCKDFKLACDIDYRDTHEIKCVDKKCELVPKE